MPEVISSIGNKNLLIESLKVGFLCSQAIPAGKIFKTYDWALEERKKGTCIICSNHSQIEKDVFDILLNGNQPLILCIPRGLKKRWEPKIKESLSTDRILIISPFPESVIRITHHTAQIKNELIFELSDKMFIPHVRQGGMLDRIIKEGQKKFSGMV